MSMRRRYLVIVRAGDSSLHPRWMSGPGERNWDIIVSYFGNDPNRFREAGVQRIDGAGPKWPALHEMIQAHQELLDGYTHIWLPDDDLDTDLATVNRLFELCDLHGLQAAQPALTWNSHFGHITTLQSPGFQLRYTNYVEVMAPCLTSAMLARSLPYFSSNLSGWGLDFIWARLADDPQRQLAIVDAVTVRHTRPVGGPNYSKLRKSGISPWDELRTFCRSNGLDEAPPIVTHGALLADGRKVEVASRPRRFAAGFILGYVPALFRSPDPRRMLRRMAGMAYKAFRNLPDRVSEFPLGRSPVKIRNVAPGMTR